MTATIRRLPVLDRIAVAYTAVYFGFLAARAAGADVVLVLDVAFYPLGLAVAWANWRNARVDWLDARTRLAWRLLAVAAMVLWLSGSVWTIWVTYFGSSPYANGVDRLATIQYVLAIAGYLSFPRRTIPQRGRWRFALDVALLVVAGFVIAFYIGLRLLADQHSEPMTVPIVEASFDWALFLVAAVGSTRKRDRVARSALTLLVASNLLSTVGNCVLPLLPAYANGHPVDGLWFGAWVLRWAAARMAWHHYVGGHADAPPAAEPEYQSTPFSYVLVGAAFVLLVVEIPSGDPLLLSMLAVASMAMGGLLVLRQFAELEENRRLFRTQVERASRFTSLVSHSSDLVLLIDEAGVVTYVSPSLTRVFGADARLAPGMRLQDILAPSDAESISTILARGPSSTPRFEARAQVAPGRWREVEAVWQDLRNDPAVNGIVVNCRDVTDRNEIQRHLRHAQKLDAMGHLAGGLAHDLNNVLAVIRGYSELLQSGMEGASTASGDLDQIMKAVDRASSVTQKVLAFSRKQPGRRSLVDLNGVLHDLGPMLGHLMKDQVEVQLSLFPGLWPVRADQGHLEQVVVNLATNARDAMPNGGVLEISTANRAVVGEPADPRSLPAGDYVAVTVRDEGVGMPAAVLSRVFEPFFTTKPKERGLGLGLSIVHGIVSDLDGRVVVDSAEGKGSSFTLLLPRAPSGAPADGLPAQH